MGPLHAVSNGFSCNLPGNLLKFTGWITAPLENNTRALQMMLVLRLVDVYQALHYSKFVSLAQTCSVRQQYIDLLNLTRLPLLSLSFTDVNADLIVDFAVLYSLTHIYIYCIYYIHTHILLNI